MKPKKERNFEHEDQFGWTNQTKIVSANDFQPIYWMKSSSCRASMKEMIDVLLTLLVLSISNFNLPGIILWPVKAGLLSNFFLKQLDNSLKFSSIDWNHDELNDMFHFCQDSLFEQNSKRVRKQLAQLIMYTKQNFCDKKCVPHAKKCVWMDGSGKFLV